MGQFTSSTSLVKKPSVSETLRILAAHEKPFLALFMNPTPTGTKADPDVKQHKHEWVEKKLKAGKDILNAALDSSATSVVTRLEYVNYIAGKSYITIDDEVMAVTAASLSSSIWTLTVTRGALGSTAATHAAGSPVLVENIYTEGADASDYETNTGVKNYNFTQIFRSDINMTGTAQAEETYGNESKISTQVAETIPNLFVQLENSMRSAIRYESGTTRKMGGLPYFVTSGMTKNSAGNKFDLDVLANDVESLLQQGVDPSDLMMAAGNNVRASIGDLKAEIIRESMTIKELNFNLETLVVPGSQKVKIAPYTPVIGANEYYLFPRKSLQIKFLRPLVTEKLAKVGDSDRMMVLMEPTLEANGWALGGALRRTGVA